MLSRIMAIIRERLGDEADRYRIPPPVFEAMRGEFLAFDAQAGSLAARFAILDEHLNPYGYMQGGMVTAAIDNTLGPLSMLVAPPNVTRRLEIKYSRAITLDLGSITVRAELVERRGRWLMFAARVYDPEERLLASARATHWVLAEDKAPD